MTNKEQTIFKKGFWKWWLAIVLFFATVLTYLNRQTIALCSPMICQEFGLSNEQYGQLVSAFRVTYAIFQIPAGFIADFFPLRLTYALAVGFWSLCGAAAAIVGGFKQLLITRAGLGIGESFNWPCATRIVANTLPPQDRALATGIFNSGAAVGSLTAAMIITPLAIHLGWRWAFFIIGAFGAFWILLWYASTKKGTNAYQAVTTVTHKTANTQSGRSSLFGNLMREVLTQPGFWLLLAVSVCINPAWYFLNEWIPKYMYDQRGFSILKAGMVTIPIFLGADIGNIAGGALVKWLMSRSWSIARARGAAMVMSVIFIAPVGIISHAEATWQCVALLAMAGFGITSVMVNYTACIQDFSFSNVGAVSGILGMFGSVLSAVVNPMIGKYIDQTGSYTAVFVAMPILAMCCLLAVMAFDRILKRKSD